jgi:hypothetical protein
MTFAQFLHETHPWLGILLGLCVVGIYDGIQKLRAWAKGRRAREE